LLIRITVPAGTTPVLRASTEMGLPNASATVSPVAR